MSDEDDAVALRGEATCFGVHFLDEWTGCVDRPQGSRVGPGVDARGDAVCSEYKNGSFGHVLFGVDKDGSTFLELTDDVGVVDDVMAHVDRRPVHAQRAFDGLDGAYYARAKTARRGHDQFFHHVGLRKRTDSSPASPRSDDARRR